MNSSTLPFRVMGPAKKFEIGTIAVFGLEQDNYKTIREQMSYKLASLTHRSNPNYKLLFSNMGEPFTSLVNRVRRWAPGPNPTQGFKKDWQDLWFNIDETINHLHKFFVIIYVTLKATDSRDAFAYINVRADRIDTLLAKLSSGEPFYLTEYSTIVLHNLNAPTDKEKKNMADNYLFDETNITVRIFPPLDQVT